MFSGPAPWQLTDFSSFSLAPVHFLLKHCWLNHVIISDHYTHGCDQFYFLVCTLPYSFSYLFIFISTVSLYYTARISSCVPTSYSPNPKLFWELAIIIIIIIMCCLWYLSYDDPVINRMLQDHYISRGTFIFSFIFIWLCEVLYSDIRALAVWEIYFLNKEVVILFFI